VKIRAMTMATMKTSLAADLVDGTLIQLNDNGAWCWFQDPRMVIDRTNSTVLISSIASSQGTNGENRGGDVDIVTFHPDTAQTTRSFIHRGLQPQDDHNAAALLIRTDGRYLAMYSRHNRDNLSYFRISTRPHDAREWKAERTFDWSDAIAAAGANSHITYSNLFYLPAEKQTYNFSRAINDDPSILISTNNGDHWTYGTKLLTEKKLGYVNGYTKYASNGTDRIDFLTTEHHPRDFNNSIYHGFIKDGKLHRSDGSVVEQNLFSYPGHSQTELTKVFATGSIFHGEKMTHAWTIAIAIDARGNPYALISARANDDPENTNFQDHRFFFIRYDGRQWQTHQLAKAGAGLWDAEEDYTGLAALNPANPDEVFISTTIDPRDDSPLSHHEIYQGTTEDEGLTWAWRPITQNSTVENLRPLVVAWDDDHSLIAWFRGTMSRSQVYDCAIVGILKRRGEQQEKIHFFPPAALGKSKSGFVLPAADQTGVYDVYAFFWCESGCDAQLTAGLAPDRMTTYRTRSAQQAEPSHFASGVDIAKGNRLLYRAYLGRVCVRSGDPIQIIARNEDFAGAGYCKVKQQ
jgi:BNR repeat-containing family member